MSLFEFISVLVSIALGLSLAQLLAGVSQFARNSSRIHYYLPHTIWLVNLILLHFLLWWSFWDYRDIEWNYARFITIALEPLTVLLVTSIATPKNFGDDGIDLKDYFHSVRRWFFAWFLVAELLFIIDGPLVFQSEPWWISYRIPQISVLGAFALGFAVRKDWAQHVSVWVVMLNMLWSSATRFMPGTFA